MTQIDTFRDARTLSGPFPGLLASARHLASTLMLGEHGRRRAGTGDAFWQFRAAQPGDAFSSIDWRRSAQTDDHFVRENEWQSSQTVQFWVDRSASMGFSSGDISKGDRAKTLALAIALLLNKAGERFGTSNGELPPKSGTRQVSLLAHHFEKDAVNLDFGFPEGGALATNSGAVFMSDFFGDFDGISAAITGAADRGVTGALLMVLDPQELSFPFYGRTVFESMTGAMRHETKKAGDLRLAYQARLEERQAALSDLARTVGWQFKVHVTDQSAQSALLWLYQAIGRQE